MPIHERSEKRKLYDKEYHKTYSPIWYKENKKEHYQKRVERKTKLKQWLYEYKKHLKCSKCGYNSHGAALEFHHPNNDKDTHIGQMICNVTSQEKILKEIEKCEVLCSNCHQILHWEMNNINSKTKVVLDICCSF